MEKIKTIKLIKYDNILLILYYLWFTCDFNYKIWVLSKNVVDITIYLVVGLLVAFTSQAIKENRLAIKKIINKRK